MAVINKLIYNDDYVWRYFFINRTLRSQNNNSLLKIKKM